MHYNTHLNITNLKQDDFKDEFTTNLTALVYILGHPLLELEASHKPINSTNGKYIIFIGMNVSNIILNMVQTLIPQVKESAYADVYQASINAITVLYRDKIFTDIRKKYTEATEIDKDMVAVGELDADEVTEYTDEELYAHMNYTLIPGLAFINMAFYVTYNDQYDLLQLDNINNPEFWYNQHFDFFIKHTNYLDFVTTI